MKYWVYTHEFLESKGIALLLGVIPHKFEVTFVVEECKRGQESPPQASALPDHRDANYLLL